MVFEFAFPDLGEGLAEGKLLELRVKPGQRVKQGETLAVVETDKVVAEIPSPKEGTLIRFGVQEGQTLKVGETLAFIETGDEEAPESSAAALVGQLESSRAAVLPESREGRASEGRAPGTSPGAARKTAASPVARRLAADMKVDLSAVKGTGPGGRALRKDILGASAQGPGEAGAAPSEKGTRKLSTLRRTLAANMEQSRTIPAAVIHELTPIDELIRTRELINSESESRIGFLPFFIRVTALALKEYPLLNAWYYPEREEYEVHEEINIGVAVDTDEGLLVPVVRRADTLTLSQIRDKVARLADEARNRKLKLDELRGGTFTLSNYGAYAGIFGRPLILPPQVGILGIGRIHQQPVVQDGSVVPAFVLPLSLVFDHRLLDGAYASRFLNRYMKLISQPQMLFMT